MDHPNSDPAVQRFLQSMPASAANSFSTEQLLGIQQAIAGRQGGKLPVDLRLTLKLPLIPSSLFVVLLAGRNQRTLSPREQAASAMAFLFVAAMALTVAVSVGLLLLYIAKSAVGINIFSEQSLGLWDWLSSW